MNLGGSSPLQSPGPSVCPFPMPAQYEEAKESKVQTVAALRNSIKSVSLPILSFIVDRLTSRPSLILPNICCDLCSVQQVLQLAINTFMLANNRHHLDINNVLNSFGAAMPGDNVV